MSSVGRTVVEERTESLYARDLIYGDWLSFERTTFTFDDGTTREFYGSTVDYDATTITTDSPFEE